MDSNMAPASPAVGSGHESEAAIEAFMEAMLGHLVGATTIACSLVADGVGIYAAAAGRGPRTAATLARECNANERLVRELLDQQASVGIFNYNADEDTYELGAEASLVFAHPNSPVYLAGGLNSLRAMFEDVDAAIETFKGNRTLGWEEHSPCLYFGVREFFRPAYLHHLVQDWIPALDGAVAKLEEGATVLDVGCGHGISTVQMARAFPSSSFIGVDFHGPSIDEARESATDKGVTNVSFEVADARDLDGRFDLVCFFDCLHDMGDPVGVAEAMKGRITSGGAAMVVEPFAMDTRVENHAALGGLLYGASALICTPCSLAQPIGRAMGSQQGEPGMRAVFEEAGYRSFERIAETPFNVVYAARP